MTKRRKADSSFADRELSHGQLELARRAPSAGDWAALRRHDVAMRRFEVSDIGAVAGVEDLLSDADRIGVFVGDGEGEVTVRPWRPEIDTQAGWLEGLVLDSSSIAFGTVFIRLEVRELARVHPASVRVFSYLDEDSSLLLNPLSGIGLQGRYAWATAQAPGRYAVIGLDCDPIALRAADVLAAIHDLLDGADLATRLAIAERVIDQLLEAPRVVEWLGRRGNSGDLDLASLDRGWPVLPFDLEVPRVSVDELREMARRIVSDANPPELQLLRSLRMPEDFR
jgi:hypothetical protein